MKIVVIIVRILLGVIFVAFGLNAFLHFLPKPMPPGIAGQFVGAMFQSHFILFVSTLEVISGALLLANLYVPLALAILAPIIVNIVMFLILLPPVGWQPGVLAAILWIFLFFHYRKYFSGIFTQRAS
jgi:putative oxidoreductase